jgi:hypothetical protein
METVAMFATGRPRLPLLRIVLIIIVALAIVNIVGHLFSPWFLLAAAVVAWIGLRSRRSFR